MRCDAVRCVAVGLGWVGLGWVGFAGAGLSWTVLGWVVLGWVGFGLSHLTAELASSLCPLVCCASNKTGTCRRDNCSPSLRAEVRRRHRAGGVPSLRRNGRQQHVTGGRKWDGRLFFQPCTPKPNSIPVHNYWKDEKVLNAKIQLTRKKHNWHTLCLN